MTPTAALIAGLTVASMVLARPGGTGAVSAGFGSTGLQNLLRTIPNATCGMPGASRPQQRGDVLYDQYDHAGPYSTRSQNYEEFLDIYDAELADDFVVPAAVRWDINGVDVQGVYGCGPGPATSVNVRVYEDAAGIPGTLVATRLNLAFTGGASFVVDLDPVVRLGPGHFWISVQANEDFVSAGQWGWIDRSAQSGEGAAWRNPGGGFGICPEWARRSTTCDIDKAAPDQVYRLRGTARSPTVCWPDCEPRSPRPIEPAY